MSDGCTPHFKRSDLPPVAAKYFLAVTDNSASTITLLPISSGGTLGAPVVTSISSGVGNYACPSPKGNYLYALTDGGNTITGYKINKNGSLTILAGSTTTNIGHYKEGIQVDPTGRFIYSAVNTIGPLYGGPGTVPLPIEVYSINPATGFFTQVSSSAVMPINSLSALASCSPDGRFLYVAGQGDFLNSSNIGAFSINQTTGALTLIGGSTYSFINQCPYGLSVTKDSKYLITSDTGNSGYEYVYPPLESGSSIFSIDATTGALTLINNFSSPLYSLQTDVDAFNNFYQTDFTVSNLRVSIVDPTSHQITSMPVAASTGFAGIAIFNEYIYYSTGTTVTQSSITTSTGALTPLSPASVSGFTQAFSMYIARYK